MKRPISVLAILGDVDHFAAAVEWIRQCGLTVETTTTAEEGLRVHREHGGDLVLLGLPLPDARASKIIGGLRHQDERVPIVVVGSDADVGCQLEALELGAQDYVGDAIENRRDLLFALGVSLGVRRTDAQFRVLRIREAATASWRGIVAASPAMKTVMRRLRAVCERTLSGATPTVLLTGEIGTGKRLLAKTLHYNSARRNRGFGELNCAALAPDELRAQLFGDPKGTSRYGLIETMDGGTLFLDEIGAAPLDLQRDLLTAIEDKRIPRGDDRIPVDVQFIAATRRDLESMAKRGEFRSDLYHRLMVTAIALPPLRERGEDVLAIAELLFAEVSAEYGLRAPALASDARTAMLRHPWPGNVRELRNEIERVALLVDDEVVRADHLSIRRSSTTVGIDAGGELSIVITGDRCPLDKVEREVIRQALVRSHNNISRAARYLAITRQTLLYRMKKYGFSSTTGPGADSVDEKGVL